MGIECRREARGERWVDDRGNVLFETPEGSVFSYVVSGHYSDAMLRVVLRKIEEFLAKTPGKALLFADFESIESFDPTIRSDSNEWLKAHAGRIDTLHTLMRSKLVSMSVTVMSMLSGMPLRAHSSRVDFERARSQASGRRAAR